MKQKRNNTCSDVNNKGYHKNYKRKIFKLKAYSKLKFYKARKVTPQSQGQQNLPQPKPVPHLIWLLLGALQHNYCGMIS